MSKFRCTEYEYDGMTMMEPVYQPSSLDKIKETIFDDSDIIIATYPKCGTTWMQEILYQVFNDGDFEGADQVPLHERFNFLERIRDNGQQEIDACLAKPPPRLLKTHMPSGFYKKTLENSKTKFIVVFRNPKDMLVSYYNFYKMASFDFDEDGTWEEFFDRFQKDKLVFGNYFETQLSWWMCRNDPRVLIVTYEDMIRDLEKVIRQVAAHVNKNVSYELVRKISERASFESMKTNSSLNHSTFQMMNHKISPFMRKGRVGDWTNYFTKEQQKYVDGLSKEKFEPEGLFLEDK